MVQGDHVLVLFGVDAIVGEVDREVTNVKFHVGCSLVVWCWLLFDFSFDRGVKFLVVGENIYEREICIQPKGRKCYSARPSPMNSFQVVDRVASQLLGYQ